MGRLQSVDSSIVPQMNCWINTYPFLDGEFVQQLGLISVCWSMGEVSVLEKSLTRLQPLSPVRCVPRPCQCKNHIFQLFRWVALVLVTRKTERWMDELVCGRPHHRWLFQASEWWIDKTIPHVRALLHFPSLAVFWSKSVRSLECHITMQPECFDTAYLTSHFFTIKCSIHPQFHCSRILASRWLVQDSESLVKP